MRRRRLCSRASLGRHQPRCWRTCAHTDVNTGGAHSSRNVYMSSWAARHDAYVQNAWSAAHLLPSPSAFPQQLPPQADLGQLLPVSSAPTPSLACCVFASTGSFSACSRARGPSRNMHARARTGYAYAYARVHTCISLFARIHADCANAAAASSRYARAQTERQRQNCRPRHTLTHTPTGASTHLMCPDERELCTGHMYTHTHTHTNIYITHTQTYISLT